MLAAAGSDSFYGFSPDIFLRLDPLSGIIIPIAVRNIVQSLLPALFTILLTLLAGRIFCGWVCPMGATLDISRKALSLVFRKRKASANSAPALRNAKYLVLILISVAAIFGVNLVFWASPIPLATRLYALVLYPAGLAGVNQVLETATPVLEQMGGNAWIYELPDPRYFATALFTGAFWLTIIALECIQPRFWCRFLCPAGALLGLLSRHAFLKRQVAPECVSCKRCSYHCKAGLLQKTPTESNPSECLACQACVSACPVKAVHFVWTSSAPAYGARLQLPSRRVFCATVATGSVLAGLSELDILHLATPNPLVRPPGSRPEPDFLNRCLRCGECMQACPTGGLQPAWFQGGLPGIFTPFLDPRIGGCLPDCAACGSVCPTQAIFSLPLQQKRWAKIGTAAVNKETCLAWAEDKRCMVCKENCPYGAIEAIAIVGHKVPVPVVHNNRCYGCGFCEKHCPQSPAAIIIESWGAIRLNNASFEKVAKEKNLNLAATPLHKISDMGNQQAPGLPPGFTE